VVYLHHLTEIIGYSVLEVVYLHHLTEIIGYSVVR